MQGWDDYRFFLAVARLGSVTKAAEHLGVNQSTVSRRMNSFEQALKVRLFERLSTGYELTEEGEELYRRVIRIEEEVYAIDRNVMGKNISLSGTIRVTCSLVIARYFLIPIIVSFNREHPGIQVELDMSNNLHNLSAREADVAIRVTRDKVPESLVGRVLGKVNYAAYIGDTYWEKSGENDEVLKWIGEDDQAVRPEWLNESATNLSLVARSNDVLVTLDLIRAGMGVGRLPLFIGEQEEGVKQLSKWQKTETADVWMLTHGDMRKVNRVRQFTRYVTDRLPALLSLY